VTCDQCSKPVYRQVFVPGTGFMGVDCHCYRERPRATTAVNPYGDLTLEHIHVDGKPLRVTSSRQLAKAEVEHNFIHVARNMDQCRMDDAPQQKVFTVGDVYKRKFGRSA